MDSQDTKKRIEEAYKLLAHETTSREKLESIRTLIKGLNPKLDMLLDSASKALSDYERLHKGDIIVLSAESLPENSPEEKKRKQAVIFLINSWRQLGAEVKRMSLEFEHLTGSNENNTATSTDKIASAGRIVAVAKGPFGIITFAAILIIGVLTVTSSQQETKEVQSKPSQVLSETSDDNVNKIQVIIVDGKKIPLSQVKVASGPDCDSDHYHAVNHISVKALDGSIVPDPGSCGFGKVKETDIVEVE
jgi:membrane-bound inhibitor of C-type lysozyme